MERITEHLPKVLRRLADRENSRVPFMEALWHEIVGHDLAAVSKPVELRDGVLTLEVSDRDWERELRKLSGRLIGKVNAFWEKRLVERIQLKVSLEGRSS